MMQLSRLYRSTGVRVGLLMVSTLILMGQGCPSPTPEPTPTPTPTPGQYVGAAVTADESQGCQRCHSTHYNNWAQTRHAGAFQTLVAAGQDKNPACIGCHTVGFGQPGGFVDAATTPQFEGVQCENCHGPARDHVNNVDDPTKRPLKSIAASVCGQCHNGTHHPTFDEWSSSGHALVTEVVAEELEAGTNANNCGVCHSGDVRNAVVINGGTVPDNYLAGKTRDQMNAVTCVICHNPHQKTGNSALSNTSGEDFQLRYPEVADPTPTNVIAATQDPTRFNACGQCHHTRSNATWQTTSRPPHHSIQANMYVGEMPIPANTQPLVDNQRSVHRFVPAQCSTCHMHTEEFESEESPASSGHTFAIDTSGCSNVGCHGTEAAAVAAMQALQTEVQGDLDSIKSRLDAAYPNNGWEYTADGGPSDQTTVLDQIKQVRFMYYWVLNDQSKGVHNPGFARAILKQAENTLTALGK
jgi:nitrate/TMAO reductase-like tetraheme cytochrome c subunit